MGARRPGPSAPVPGSGPVDGSAADAARRLLAEGRLATNLGNRSLLDSSAHFRAMREHHRAAVITPYGRTG